MLRTTSKRAFTLTGRTLNRPMAAQFHASAPQRKEEDQVAPGFFDKYDLYNPVKFVPLTIGGFGLATATGLYHWDEESQLLGLFALFTGTIYAKGGDAIGAMFDETSDAILKEHQALEDAQIEAAKLTLQAHENQTGIYGDIKGIFDAQKDLMDGIVDAATNRLKHEVRAEFVKKLDTVVSMESEIGESTKAALVEGAADFVKSQFQNDTGNLRDASLQAALSAISDPASASDESVQNLYKGYFAQFGQNLEAARDVEQELNADTLEKMKESMDTVARRDGLLHLVPEPTTKISIGNI